MADAGQRPSPLMIRGIDPDVWRRVRSEAVLRGMTAGEMLNEILRTWCAQNLK